MHYAAGIHRWLLAMAGIMACGALVDTASAQAQNLATCHFQTHITLSGTPSGGTFASDGDRSASCTGELSSSLAGAHGVFAAQGSYGMGAQGDTCAIGFWQGTFDAQVPQVISFFDPQYALLSGSLQLMRVAQGLAVSGTGTVNGQPVSYVGAGSFTPDSGQGCGGAPITGGLLAEQVAIIDGGGAGSSQQAGPSRSGGHHRRHNKLHRRRHHPR